MRWIIDTAWAAQAGWPSALAGALCRAGQSARRAAGGGRGSGQALLLRESSGGQRRCPATATAGGRQAMLAAVQRGVRRVPPKQRGRPKHRGRAQPGPALARNESRELPPRSNTPHCARGPARRLCASGFGGAPVFCTLPAWQLGRRPPRPALSKHAACVCEPRRATPRIPPLHEASSTTDDGTYHVWSLAWREGGLPRCQPSNPRAMPTP